MRCITLHQPWASLVSIGAKTIETRSWSTGYRGRLAIHAAKVLPEYGRRECYKEPFLSGLLDAGLLENITHRIITDLSELRGYRNLLPLGAILCTCNLVACVPTEWCQTDPDIPAGYNVHTRANRNIVGVFLSEQEAAFGNYAPGRYAWLLEDIQPLPEPIPARGYQGLWETDLL